MSSHRWLQPSPQGPSTFSPASSEGPGPTSDPADLDDGTARSSSPSDGHIRNPRKRPAEDLSQCAERTARNLRLKLESTEVLKAYGELPAAEQSIWLAGRDLEGAIDQYHFLVMIDPNASTYVKKGKTSPINRLTGHLLRIPNSGLTSALTHDKSKMNVIEGRMRYKFTHSRNLIKDLIVESVGNPDTEDESGQSMDIITLCQQVIDLGSSKLTTDIKVSVEMCGRFAFLRETCVTFAKALATPSEKKTELRESKNHDKVRISTVIGDILADDRKAYGAADLDQFIKESPPMFS
ncbi:hypothetical protein B0H14DRAFT_3891014 [Mycena olivaceomarginata]|nr:hypothetical protein B0H14DRAFT_3891014 [Mycena olivaceomarginata]